MKKLSIVIFTLALFLSLPFMAYAEEVNVFSSAITIQSNSSIVVTENIGYDFGILERHGIYRDIPYQYQARGGNYSLDINILSVQDESGAKVNHTESRSGGKLRIKIGDADKMLIGQKNYFIKYEVAGALNYFDDHDELYWNVTGNDWVVNIKKAAASVSLPNLSINQDNLKTACYAGELGSSDQSLCKVTMDQTNKKINFTYTGGTLAPGQGLTLVLSFPKGLVHQPSLGEIILKRITDNLIVFLPLLVLIFLLWYWNKYGRDARGRGTVVPEFGPPEGVLPAEAGVVYDEKMDDKDTAATVIDLARRGYLKLKQSEQKKVLGFNVSGDWSIIKLKPLDEELEVFEHNLLSAFFEGVEAKKEVVLAQLKRDSHLMMKMKEFKKNIYNSVTLKGWFASNPDKIRGKFSGIGIGILVVIYIFADVFDMVKIGGTFGMLAVGLSAVLFLIFARLMPKKTPEGALLKEKLEGFKMFLAVTEKDRVAFNFSPAKNPEKFAEYLPWAIIFGVEKEWATVFADIDLPQPEWCEGYWAGNFNALMLSNALSSFNHDFNKSLTAAGAAAASGGSGLGGGGFSGGGFGGGGGGSW
ncbi:MAG TPA: DUF2207 domain-containing protein [bacterium]|nr:DUF2207 domain-containing protein [bacterium]